MPQSFAPDDPAGGAVASPAASPTPAPAAAPVAPASGEGTSAKPDAKPDLTGVTAFARKYLGLPADAAKKPAAAVAPTAKAKVPAKPKPARLGEQPPAALTQEQIAAAAAEGVARAFPREQPRRETEPAAAPLSPEDKRKVAVLDKLSEMYPDKYKDISKKYLDGNQKLNAYVTEWEQEHPGQEFKRDDPEHDAFFAKNDVDWDDEDYQEAAVEVRLEKKLEKERKETGSRLSEFERREKLRDSAGAIGMEQTVAARHFWGLLGEEYADIVAENGLVNLPKLQEIQTKDPVISQIRVETAEALDRDVGIIYTLLNGLATYDEKNPVHQDLSTFAANQERLMLASAPEEKTDAEGRSFLPADKYFKLSKTAREQDHWTFTARDIAVLRAADLARKAADRVAKEEEKYLRWAKAKGLSVEAATHSGRNGAEPELEEEAEPADLKPVSPESVAQPKTAARAPKNGDEHASPLSAFVMRSFGKR